MSEIESVRAALDDAAQLLRTVASMRAPVVVQAASAICEALERGRHVLVFGNGGSAADAQHFAAELVGRFVKARHALPAVALTTDTSILTSVGNDFGFDQVFARQIDALGRAGDIAMAITTSGASANINVAIERARAAAMITIGLTGRDGGQTGRLVDVHVNVPSTSTARIQEAQIAILHVMCELIEKGM